MAYTDDQDEYVDYSDEPIENEHANYLDTAVAHYSVKERKKMLKWEITKMKSNKVKSIKKQKKPILIQVGSHYINPIDVRLITKIKKGLYIVKFISDPNPEWPCWIREEEINALLDFFEIKSEG